MRVCGGVCERDTEMKPEDSRKKLKTGDRLAKPLGLKKKKKNKEQHNEKKNYKLVQEENPHSVKEENRKKISSGQKRRKRENGNKVDQFSPEDVPDGGKKKSKLLRNKEKDEKIMEVKIGKVHEHTYEGEDGFDEHNGANEAREKKKSKLKEKRRKNEKINKIDIGRVEEFYNDVEDDLNQESKANSHLVNEEKRKKRSLGQKRRKREDGNKVDQFSTEDGGKKESKLSRKKEKDKKIMEAEIGKVNERYYEVEDGFDEHNGANEAGEKKKSKLKKNRRKNEKIKKADIGRVEELYNAVEDDHPNQESDGGKMEAIRSENQRKTESSEGPSEADTGTDFKTRKSKKPRKTKKKDHIASKKDEKVLKRRGEDEVYEISSGDEDCSSGMKKWITEYHQRRPGLKILQQRIDDFITDYEAQEEQVRKEREARAAEGGWTVVVHHKGRKKTTDSESGIAVGSVAQAAVLDKMAKKKSKEVGLDFYRFQRREAKRNEIMMLQSKFEQDKKRIQQLRAARKFRPY